MAISKKSGGNKVCYSSLDGSRLCRFLRTVHSAAHLATYAAATAYMTIIRLEVLQMIIKTEQLGKPLLSANSSAL